MGGNAIKKFFAGLTAAGSDDQEEKAPDRLPRYKYLIIEDEVIKLLSPFFKNWRIPRYFDDKLDFGDCDIIYVPTEDFDINKVKEALGSHAIVKNGSIHSMEYNMFQIDLIRVTEDLLDVTSSFFSWSLFGKFVGMICAAHGFKFGIQGLYVKIFDKDGSEKNNFQHSYIGNITLCTNIQEIFKFLGLNYYVFNKGFSIESELFEFIKTSRMFEPWIFHTDKVRRNEAAIKKRLEEFDRFVSTFEMTELPSQEERDAIKEKALEEALNHFNKKEEYDQLIKDNDKKKEFRIKFNGSIVRDITGLQNQELGKFVNFLRSSKEFMEYCDNSSTEEIVLKIKTEHLLYEELLKPPELKPK